jgi:hypothetical protein
VKKNLGRLAKNYVKIVLTSFMRLALLVKRLLRKIIYYNHQLIINGEIGKKAGALNVVKNVVRAEKSLIMIMFIMKMETLIVRIVIPAILLCAMNAIILSQWMILFMLMK